MAVIAEKTATVGQIIDDIASTLSNLSAWNDADTGMVNDQSTEDWHNNGRVFENTNTGTYLAFYVAPANAQNDNFRNHNNRNPIGGIRFLHSSDWDPERHVPDGLTNVSFGDNTIRSRVTRERHYSFGEDLPNLSEQSNTFNNGKRDRQQGVGLWLFYNWGNPNRSTLAGTEATYFISAAGNYLTVAAWNNSNANYGTAGYLSWEWVDNKFYDDGTTPVAICERTTACGNNNNAATSAGDNIYGFEGYTGAGDLWERGMVGGYRCVGEGDWGALNPDANDDTFFVRRPVIYENPNESHPVAYVEDAIPNDLQEGVAHGDTVTFNSVDYRSVRQSGASMTEPIVACLRYE